MEKLNIAEILRHCPKGMELDCTLVEGLEFDDIVDNEILPIRCRIKNPNGGYNVYNFTKYGCWFNTTFAKCVIFPKGKTTWEGFQIPFKDGDVLIHTQNKRFIMSIYRNWDIGLLINTHCILWDEDEGLSIGKKICCYSDNIRLATEEEKQKLFDAIRANGYKWNDETKTLEKLVEPKFKVGDRVLWNYDTEIPRTISRVKFASKRGYVYWIDCEGCSSGWWDETELTPTPNKFDITTLKPFSKVLVRQNVYGKWDIDFFGYYNKGDHHTTGPCIYKQCVPYEGNEHLLGTTDDCDNYYKTWE